VTVVKGKGNMIFLHRSTLSEEFVSLGNIDRGNRFKKILKRLHATSLLTQKKRKGYEWCEWYSLLWCVYLYV